AGAEIQQVSDGRPHDDRDVGDAPTAGADGDGIAGPDGKSDGGEPGGHGAGDVPDQGPGEVLADTEHAREGHNASYRAVPLKSKGFSLPDMISFRRCSPDPCSSSSSSSSSAAVAGSAACP